MPKLKNTTKEPIESLGYQFPVSGLVVAVPIDAFTRMLKDRRISGLMVRRALLMTCGKDLIEAAALTEDEDHVADVGKLVVEAMTAAPSKPEVTAPTISDNLREEIKQASNHHLIDMMGKAVISRKVSGKLMDDDQMRATLIAHHFPRAPSPKGKGKTDKTKG